MSENYSYIGELRSLDEKVQRSINKTLESVNVESSCYRVGSDLLKTVFNCDRMKDAINMAEVAWTSKPWDVNYVLIGDTYRVIHVFEKDYNRDKF